MFTGLIEKTGIITNISTNKVCIKSDFAQELKLGDSICINGTCLTVTHIAAPYFDADISPETLRVTNWKYKKIGDHVNLERSLKLGSKLDGHIVYGHVDTISKITDIVKLNNFSILKIEIPQTYKNLVVSKGSITIDGISLTIAKVDSNNIEIAVIPHTNGFTTLNSLKINDIVNIEFDMIAKYVEKNLAIYHNKSKIDMNFLEENGFL